MLKTMIATGLVAGLALLSGCTSQVELAQYSTGKLSPAVLTTPVFPIQGMVPAPGAYQRLRVYIEGDGHAWATSSQPSTNPTPHRSLMLRLVTDDPGPSAYLARPCQFVTSTACGYEVWTGSRFAKPEIESMNLALSALKRQYSVRTFELVGHSGGGEVALVLAGMRDDVVQVQTIAGNVDPEFWVGLHHLTPLARPITPMQYEDRLRAIPQRHLVGSRDPIVPASVVQAYDAQLQADCLEIVHVDADHSEGYDTTWSRLANQPIPCR